MKQWCVWLVVVACWAGPVRADTRIWTAKNGQTVEAEYIKIIGSKVVLKKADGKTTQVPIKALSAADQQHLAALIPPKIKISVDVDKDRDTTESYSSEYGTFGYEKKMETTKCRVTIDKTNREPCSRSFTARIYVMAEGLRNDTTKVMDVSEHTFHFKSSKSTSFASKPASLSFSDSSYDGKQGYRYAGYIVVVQDANGGIVAIESSKTSYEKCVNKILKVKADDHLDKDLDVIN